MLPEEVLKLKLRVNFFRPVLDIMEAAIGRFNDDCVQVINHISAVFPASYVLPGSTSCWPVWHSWDGNLCVAVAQQLATYIQYGSTTSLINLARQMERE